MGHNVGDAAKAAVQRSETKTTVKLTPEQLIQALRNNLRANPPIGAYVPTHQIQALLDQYDHTQALLGASTELSRMHAITLEVLTAERDQLKLEKQVMTETILGLTQTIQMLEAPENRTKLL